MTTEHNPKPTLEYAVTIISIQLTTLLLKYGEDLDKMPHSCSLPILAAQRELREAVESMEEEE